MQRLTWEKTKALNISVFFFFLASSSLSWSKCRILLPSKLSTRRTVTWYKACSFFFFWQIINSRNTTLINFIKWYKYVTYLYQQVPPHNVCYKRLPDTETNDFHKSIINWTFFLEHLKKKKKHLRPTGFLSMRWSVGGSVANARAPRVSMMRFTQSSCTAFSGTSPEETAATTLITRAATFTVSWNWMNFWIFA